MLATLIGTTIEWYDFFVYGTAAALILNQLFFPDFSETAGTLAAFVTFAVGWFARPLGGVIAGHFGDRIGRKSMLVLTLLLMGVSTVAIGLLPTYQTIGVMAPVLLVVFRLVQGLAVGGEWGGAVLMAVEHAPEGRRGFYGSWPQMGVPAGLVLGTAVFYAFASLPEEQFLAWGWRVPFLLSALLVAVGLFIRLQILETPAFSRVREANSEVRAPVLETVRTHPWRILMTIGAHVGPNTYFYTFATFVLAYATQRLGLESGVILLGVMIAATVDFFSIPLWASLSDRLGRRPLYMAGLLFLVMFTFPFFWLLDTGNPLLVYLALVLGLGFGHAMLYGTQASFFAELFDTRVRYTGISLGFQLAGTIAGAPLPIIATALVAATGGAPWLFAVYSMILGSISLVAVYLAPETFRRDIYEDAPDLARPDRSTVGGGVT